MREKAAQRAGGFVEAVPAAHDKGLSVQPEDPLLHGQAMDLGFGRRQETTAERFRDRILLARQLHR
ncbi:MAG: hypothetical protein E7K72_10460 [Roseomonas mucosa]|nr:MULTISPECIES: hypothetical protein [Roseomonas]MBS5902657.1 hypothetical protein [Acetobacteraceae bacterium]MDT8266551.1 hypothetical protein [Roseomonas sp. DSM 102946]MCG7351935.1 hypothetical protein [Roseomonas mucosa]MCG7355649.1 hypothetical protein [Roseomonas mucosa]MDT8278033.1 hypothetical protein [Roseomonas mucosa]